MTFDDITTDPATGRAPVAAHGGLLFSGASAASAAALPPGLRAGAASPPVALVNAPGDGSGAIEIAVAAANATFAPQAVILTEDGGGVGRFDR